ncbi:MAG TPA: peptidylprolyl isomerase [Burkholderiaceae bacterium]|jgi:peptidyl-prolyl cis-trans isomerase C|nr:peptidylprolyl isomerase [Burkholderiaceae bacterium]
MTPIVHTAPASVNGVALHAPGEVLADEALRQRACTELLRQAAQHAGLLAADDPAPVDGATSEAATAAIEALLARELSVPEPSEEACRRHYAAHESNFRVGDRARVRHVLFAVTPGVDVRLLRQRAEAALLELRCHREGEADRFAAVAGELSNCPSAAQGGDLGWLTRADCAPEFARELFAGPEIGVMPRLVHSRFGLHVVEVLARESGHAPAFESVRGAAALALRQQTFVTALRQYLQLLAGGAAIVGVQLDSADTPLVQ